jgi:hypothetical protein
MVLVDYELKTAGATYAAKYNALDEHRWVWTPISAKFIAAVAQTQYRTG